MRTMIFGDEMSKEKVEVETYVRNVGTAFTLVINNNIDISFNTLEDYDEFVGKILTSFKKAKDEAYAIGGNLTR
jgi:hypothetical protein